MDQLYASKGRSAREIGGSQSESNRPKTQGAFQLVLKTRPSTGQDWLPPPILATERRNLSSAERLTSREAHLKKTIDVHGVGSDRGGGPKAGKKEAGAGSKGGANKASATKGRAKPPSSKSS